jgi:magnesium transporter
MVESWFLFKKRSDFFTHKGTNQNSIEYRSFKKADFAVPSLDAIILRHNREWEDKVEELIVLSSSADPKIWNELRNTEIISTFKRSYSASDSLYAIKSLKEDKDFKVIEVEIFSYFSDCIKKLRTLEQTLIWGC